MKILVIEDQTELRDVVAETFREESFATDTASDGEVGLYKALNWNYDLIILDVLLPKMNGWEVLEKLREKKNTAVLMLTALDSVKDKIKGLNHGADDYLAKPFHLHELIARAKAIMRRESTSRNPRLSAGGVVLDTNSRQATLDGTPVDLTAREYAMAELFLRHPNEVLDREFLHEHLCDENDDTLSNVLDVFIYKLRQKFGKDFIETRRGQGYIVKS